MICDHPECTGVHDGSRPRASHCPATRARRAELQRGYQRRYSRTAKGMLAAMRAHAKERGNR